MPACVRSARTRGSPDGHLRPPWAGTSPRSASSRTATAARPKRTSGPGALACGADDQIPDLIATVRHVASMYHEYRRQMQAGMKHLTGVVRPAVRADILFRIYDTTVVPGLFTTAEYAAALFRFWQAFMGLKDDVDAAVEARMERQRVLYTGDRQFRVVIEEQVLRTRVGRRRRDGGPARPAHGGHVPAPGQHRHHPGGRRPAQPDPGKSSGCSTTRGSGSRPSPPA